MKLHSILTIPAVFVAGILSIVVLQRVGIVNIDYPADAEIALSQAASEGSMTGSSSGLTIDGLAIGSVQQNASVAVGKNIASSSKSAELSNLRLNERIDELQLQLRSATVNADRMQAEIDQLGQQVETASLGNEFLPNGEGANAVVGESSSQAIAQDDRNRFNRSWGFNGSDGDEQYANLVSAGVDPSVAEELKKRDDQWSLQRLELVDQATREGWRRSDQFGERMSDLRDERPDLRAELGDDRYDSYLFAAGDFNRVQVSSIIDGSAASLAGIENGDIVVSYANQRVFTMRELQQATSAGSRGESVQVNLIRSGELFAIDVPRGPLGVSLSGARADPSSF